MKTAEEILVEIDQAVGLNDSRTLFEWEDVVKAMKLYANQKLDEVAEKATAKFNFTDRSFDAELIVDKESILSLKDKI